MKAVQLAGLEGLGSLQLVELERPRPSPNEIVIEVKAAGINFAELEMANILRRDRCQRFWDLRQRDW